MRSSTKRKQKGTKKVLVLKNKMRELKNSTERSFNRLDQAEERIRELEDRHWKLGNWRRKKVKRMKAAYGTSGIPNRNNVCIIIVLEGKRREKGLI